MSDLERALSEAQKARREAEAATQRASDLEAQAETARGRARQEQGARRRRWAQQVVDAYDADVTKADAAIQQAQATFDRTAVENLSGAVEAYVAWGEASIRHYALQLRVSAAAPILDLDASTAELIAPPLFSDALDAALAEAVGKRADAARQEVETERARLQDGA